MVIKLKNVNKIYGRKLTRVHAIKNLSLEINQGEFIVILGKSGSGKSTLLSLMSGLEKPNNGDVFLNNNNITNMNENQLAKLRRFNIGFIFQHFNLINAMTSFENTELPGIIAGLPKKLRQQRARALLERVGLATRASHFPDELSGGERQRVGITRSLINQPKFIIADEPTGDLDSENGYEIVNLLWELNRGTRIDGFSLWKPTIIMVTHDQNLIKEGMRVLELSDGVITSDITNMNSSSK